MKYISLFSGIGGFEIAIHNIFPEAICVGYSEVDKFAIKVVYEHHFPDHRNLGDVTEITEQAIKELVEGCGGIDLVVGGFPCQNLTSMARSNNCNSNGLDGPKSGLFWNMINILTWIQRYQNNELNILIENNASMTTLNKQLITENLQNIFNNRVFVKLLNGSDFGVQARRRLYWTLWDIDTVNIVCHQTWNDVL